MFQEIAKHSANDASLTMHRPPLQMFACHSDWLRSKIDANIHSTAFIHSMTHQQFKFNYTQVMEAMARKEAGESPNKRPAQSQAQVRLFTVIVQVSIYHFFGSFFLIHVYRLPKTTRARGPSAAQVPPSGFKTRSRLLSFALSNAYPPLSWNHFFLD